MMWMKMRVVALNVEKASWGAKSVRAACGPGRPRGKIRPQLLLEFYQYAMDFMQAVSNN